MTEPRNLAATIDKIADVRVLCVGDVMLDRFVYGAVERVSPEAPIPVLRIEAEDEVLGGAGNVVRNIAALGGQARLLSVIGSDPLAQSITDLLEGEPRITANLVADTTRRITVKTRYVASGQQLLRADAETEVPPDEATRQRLMVAFDNMIADTDAVVLSDYGKGVLSDDVLRAIIESAKAHGKPVLVDPKGRDFTRYAGVDIITPNERELAAATAMTIAGEADVVAAGRHIAQACDVAAVVVTRSGRGISIVRSDAVEHLPVRAREVFDVSGAGDTVIAALAMAVGAGINLGDAATLANYAAGVVVGKVGTAVVYPAELAAAFQDVPGGTADKNTELDVARDRVATWRRQGLKIGFTNGCFDVLHPGHVHLLQQARAACDRLIVGLNSDDSVKRLKGPKRPIHESGERAMMLGSHGSVDLVVVFEDDTPLSLIEALRPDVLVKGADYAIDEVVGGDVVRGYGGDVVLATLKSGYSTTGTIARLRQSSAT